MRRLGLEIPDLEVMTAEEARYAWYDIYDGVVELSEKLFLAASQEYDQEVLQVTEADRRAIRKEARAIKQSADKFLLELNEAASELAAASITKFGAAQKAVKEAEVELQSEIQRWEFWSRMAKHLALAASAVAAFA